MLAGTAGRICARRTIAQNLRVPWLLSDADPVPHRSDAVTGGGRPRVRAGLPVQSSEHLLTMQHDVEALALLLLGHPQADNHVGELQQQPASERAPDDGHNDTHRLDTQ
jgi:hypothetical protein